jgi:hypothetical protein
MGGWVGRKGWGVSLKAYNVAFPTVDFNTPEGSLTRNKLIMSEQDQKELDANSSTSTTDDKGQSTESRSDYWNKWNKLTNDSLKDLEAETEEEKKKADAAVGLNKSYKSEAEKLDKEKDGQLRKEKEAWDKKKKQLDDMKQFVSDEIGADRTFTKDDFDKPVIIFKGVKDCRYVFPAEIGAKVIKIFLEGCENCTFIFDVVVITQHIEMAHCTNCTFTLQKPLATAQIDLSSDCKILYEAGAAFKDGDKIYTAGSTNITVSVVSHEDVVVSYQELVSVLDDDGTPANERQFVTQLVNGKMTTEPVVRLGSAPSTRRELVSGDEHVTLDAQRQAELSKEKGNESFGNREYAQAGIFYTMAMGK